MKSNATMKIEFLAGTDLVDAIKEASRIAMFMGLVYVNFSFNGIEFSVGNNPSPEATDKAISEYYNKKNI